MNQPEEPLGSNTVAHRAETSSTGRPLQQAQRRAHAAAEALRLQEQQYQTLMAAIPQLVWMTNAQGMPEYFNQQWLDYTDFTVTENLEENWAYLVHPEDRAAAASAWMNAVETGAPYEVEYRLRRYDGVFRWFLVRGVPLRDEQGQIIQWFGTCTDIDAAKRKQQTQEFLAQLDAHIRPLSAPNDVLWEAVCAVGRYLGVSRCGYTEIDLDRDVCTNHRQFCAGPPISPVSLPLSVFGEEMLSRSRQGQTVVIADTKTDPLTAPNYESLYAPLEVRAFLTVPLCKNGKWIASLTVSMTDEPRAWTEEETELLKAVVERSWLAVQNAWEAQERLRAEQALQTSETRFRMLVEQSPLSIQILSPEGRTLQVNRAWEQLWGLTLDDLADYNMLQDPQLAEKGILPYIQRAFAGEAVSIPPVLYDTEQTLPHRTKRTESQQWTQAFMYPVKDEAGRIREVVLIHEDITEQKRMEEALLDSAKQMRLLADNAPAYISNIDTQYRYVFANRASAERFGLTPEEIVGKTVEEVMGRAAFETIRPYMDRAFRGETFSYETTVPYERIGTRTMQVFFAPDIAENGLVRGLVAVVHDITERKEADKARAYLAAIIPSSEDAIVSKDLNGIVTSWNPAAERIYGYTAGEMIGKSKALVIPPELPDELPNILHKIRAGERIEHYETVRIRKDGERVNLSITVSPIRDHTGQVIGASTIARDITERIQGEEERARLAGEVTNQRRRLDDLIGSVPGVVWEAWGQPDSENQRINFVSDYVETMLGYTVEEWLTTPNFWLTIVHPEDREQAAHAAAEAWARGSQHINVFRWVRKDGKALWCESHSAVIHDAEGNPIGMRGVTIDVSERRRLEMRLREETKTLETIYDVGQQLSAELDLEKMVQSATDAATQLTGAQFGAFFYNVVNAAGESYMLYTISGVPREKFSQFPMPRNTAVFAPTFAGEGTVRLDDVTQDPRYGKNAPYHGKPPGHLPVVSYLAVPVVSRSGEVLGGLFFGHEQPGMFTERHERIVEGLAAQSAIAIDNARLFQAERERSEQLAIAVKEVHHRVKNSLQGVSALLEMQIMSDEAMLPVEVIRDSLSQIKTIALVHDLLAHDQPIGKVDVAQVLTKLIAMLSITLGTSDTPLPIRLEAVSLWIPIRPAIALALVVNELLTNAAKHCPTPSVKDASRYDATIYVSLQPSEDKVCVAVQDCGPGFPPGFDPVLHAHIGLELVQTLVTNDLKGSVSFGNRVARSGATDRLDERGARVEILFTPARLSD